ncbi:unnamed protein product [Brachionus calyciflorus]|uniref:GRIP domain-containing protein n=1 Tax=Brachionus calyciflorus TaxID=104777 RepID=A0A813M4W4_9BILA|nr:unnamed protein product [Brachionus calyciflorus]
MSWLASGLTQSVTGKISQLGGQLKDILTEGTEEIYDPENELKVVNEKLKDNEKRLELLKSECARWEDETNELNLRCQTYETQLEQKQNEFRQTLITKDALIAELRSQINLLENSRNNDLTHGGGYQKSAFMEEYEEVMPSSDLNDYIHLDKEIKRLKEDILYLQNENQDLLAKIKLKNEQLERANSSERNQNVINEKNSQIESLKQEIEELKNRIQNDFNKHQNDMNELQNSFTDRINLEIEGKQHEIEGLKIELEKVKSEFDSFKISSEISLEINNQNNEIVQNIESNLAEKNQEIHQLKSQIEMFESELEQANNQILKLKTESKKSPETVLVNDQTDLISQLNVEKEKLEAILSENQTEIENLRDKIQNLENELNNKNSQMESFDLKIEELTQQNDVLSSLNETQESQLISKQTEIEELNKKFQNLDMSETIGQHEEMELLKSQIDEKQKEIEALQLDLKQQQQNLHQEKILQLQEQKQDRQEIAKLKSENTELKIKLDEKLSEINLLGQQINDLNTSINQLKSNDSNLFNELKAKTEQFLAQIDSANQEIFQLRGEKEKFEFCLEEKSREISQLKLDLEKNVQHISAQSKAIEKLQSDLKQESSEKNEHEELLLLKNQYNQIYSYLEQKNQESLSYYNEIQRLNLVVSELNTELFNAKKLNENLSEQYDNLLKGFQYEQKMVEDLTEQTSELNTHLLNIKADADSQKMGSENLEKFQLEIELLTKERDEMGSKLKNLEDYYENMLETQSNSFKQTLNAEEQQRDKLRKELDRLKVHLVEISDSYTKEAIQAEEREKQLRLSLNEAQNKIQLQGANLENSNKDLSQRMDQLNQANQNLTMEKDALKEKLKQTEENLNHQIKVTKNLELVLERVQNDHASTIHQLQKENKKYQDEIRKLNETLDAINTLELELNEREEDIKKLHAQIETKEALIESLEKRFNEVQKVNDGFIEKEIIKNLIIGYIKVPQVHEKKQVLKLIATMLGFNQSELEQAEQGSESKWFGSFLSKSTPLKNPKNTSNESSGKSFTELLIQYVERESRPKPNLQFDLNKKTDSPLNDSLNSSNSSSNLPSSESALQFFNSVNNSDLTLVNRSTNAPNTIAGISSPAVANSFLEQILK